MNGYPKVFDCGRPQFGRPFGKRGKGREQVLHEAVAAWNEYQKNGLHVTAEEADSWLNCLERGEDCVPTLKGSRPRGSALEEIYRERYTILEKIAPALCEHVAANFKGHSRGASHYDVGRLSR